ncbi:MAG TPA: tol-pal system-associated acyl-CoA thioesterase [Rhodanobacteraceae bacterium]
MTEKGHSDPGFPGSQLAPEPTFRWRTRVYWEDTDAGGVVYNANYLRFLERARSEWMRAAGVSQAALRESHGIVFVVRELSIAYDQPARLDDELDSSVEVERVRSASLDFRQIINRVADGAMLAHATVRVACVDATRFVPCRIPRDIAALIQGNQPA